MDGLDEHGNMALSLAQLLHKGERTLKEVRERYHVKPQDAAKRLGLKKKLVRGLEPWQSSPLWRLHPVKKLLYWYKT